MDVYYDYLFDNICTGSAPYDFNIEFTTQRYPTLDEVKERARDLLESNIEALTSPPNNTMVLAMIVSTRWNGSCIEEDEDEYPEYRSDGFQAVELGPYINTKHEF